MAGLCSRTRDYAFIITTNDRGAPPKPRTAYTDAEAAALLEGLGASSGAYEVSGSTWTRRPLVAANPAQVGTESAMEFSLDGDELTWVGGLIPDQGDLVWRKVG